METSAEPETHVKKRGRPRKEELPSDKQELRDDDEDEHRAKKKPRKSNGVARQDNKRDSDEDDEIIGNMKKHMKVSSWEDLIESIDTVEREGDNELYVFFTLQVVRPWSRPPVLTVSLGNVTISVYGRTRASAQRSSPRRWVLACDYSTDTDCFSEPAHHVLRVELAVEERGRPG